MDLHPDSDNDLDPQPDPHRDHTLNLHPPSLDPIADLLFFILILIPSQTSTLNLILTYTLTQIFFLVKILVLTNLYTHCGAQTTLR